MSTVTANAVTPRTGADVDEQAILDRVLESLGGVRSQHGYWIACCPAHDDSSPSLSVTRGTEQPVVLKCHAGCDPVDILAAIGMTLADVSVPRDETQRGEWTPHGEASEVYRYAGEDGQLLYEVLRVPQPGGKKIFSQRIPKPGGGWIWRLGNTRRVLYRLPRLRKAIEDGEMVYVVEGEKDVHAVERTGNVATCNPGGTGGGWREEYSEVLRDAIVVVVADADAPGRKHARRVAKSLSGIAAAVEIQEPAEGKDVSDHLAAGRLLSELILTYEGDVSPAELAVDLTVFVRQPDPPQCWVIPELIERGDRIIWTGTPGLGKTMVTRQIAIAAAAGIHPFQLHKIPRQRVLFLDCENSQRRSKRKFRDLMAVCERLHFPLQPGSFYVEHCPSGIDVTRADDADFVLERVTAYKPDLLVIGPLYKLHAIDANEELSARAITHVLDLALGISGSALLVEAHAPHGDLLRPAGSGLFTRWPDFGYGMRMADQNQAHPRRTVKIEAWRGPRDEYEWPERLVWGKQPQEFPWVDPSTEARTVHSSRRQPVLAGTGADWRSNDDD